MPVQRSAAEACIDAVVTGPRSVGQNFSGSVWYCWTTPFAVQMKKANTGFCDCAHAERSGRPSKKGRPMATPPAPRRNALRLMPNFVLRAFIAHLAFGR